MSKENKTTSLKSAITNGISSVLIKLIWQHSTTGIILFKAPIKIGLYAEAKQNHRRTLQRYYDQTKRLRKIDQELTRLIKECGGVKGLWVNNYYDRITGALKEWHNLKQERDQIIFSIGKGSKNLHGRTMRQDQRTKEGGINAPKPSNHDFLSPRTATAHDPSGSHISKKTEQGDGKNASTD